MARNFVKIDEWEIWIPDIVLNEQNEKYPTAVTERDLYRLDPNEALSMEIRHLSKAEVRALQDTANAFMLRGKMEKEDEKHARSLLADNVRNIKNYTIGEIRITDGTGLYDHGEGVLCNEASRALVSRSSLDAGLAKKLKSPSACKCSEDQSADGDVRVVTPQ